MLKAHMQSSEVSESTTKRKMHQEDFIPQPHLKGKKIICRVWSDDGKNGMPVVVARKKVKFGTFKFEVRGLGNPRYYKINYPTLKQDGKNFIYDVHFNDAVGSLSFHRFPEEMPSDEAYNIFEYNAVNAYVKKGGIPLYYLLIAMGVAMIAFMAIIFVIPPALQAQEAMKDLDAQVSQLKATNNALAVENENLRSQIPNG